VISRKDVSGMTDAEINKAISLLQDERTSRALDNADPEILAHQAMESGFTMTGDPVVPRDMGNGIVAIMSMVKDTSQTKHRCHLYTIKESLEDVQEYWVWEEQSPSYLYSETAKVDKIRRTVSLHSLADDAVIIQHSMVWDGSRHDRKSVVGYQIHHVCDDDGEITETEISKLSNIVVKKLPPPSFQDGY